MSGSSSGSFFCEGSEDDASFVGVLELAAEDVEGEAVVSELESALRVVCVEVDVVVVDILKAVNLERCLEPSKRLHQCDFL